MTIFTPQFDQSSPGLITGYLRSEPMNGLTQQLTKRGLPWAQVGDCLLICGDCLEVLPMLEAGSVDAVVTDPPYGIGADKQLKERANKQHGKAMAPSKDYGDLEWDQSPAPAESISECRRIGRWQVIFGGNYFELPPSRCWLVWDKLNGENDYADCELAWTNLSKAVRRIQFRWHGMLRDEDDERVHPTQKPVRVMQWAMAHCPDSSAILDPFAGSFTTAVACIRTGRKFIGIEKERKYFDIGLERCRKEVERLALFEPVPQVVQGGLFDG
jgi:DNA modification methylase